MNPYRKARNLARELGLGRLRIAVRDTLNAQPSWTAVPPHRLKDLDPEGSVPEDWVALTFDDGPNPNVTPAILDLLASRGARATFFMCGLAAERHPDLVKRVAEAGHSIGGHTWDHPRSGVRGLTETDYRRQIDDTHQLLTQITGEPVRWFRPPRGMTDRPTWSLMRSRGLTTVMWSVDGVDCRLRDPVEIAAGVLNTIEPGGIVLLHDNNANMLFEPEPAVYGEVGNQETTIEATKIILDGFEARGLTSVAMDDLPIKEMPKTSRPRVSFSR
jgi:peptidoglycan/xylan/chitin deacetylase (PgdA/CDA1 family)